MAYASSLQLVEEAHDHRSCCVCSNRHIEDAVTTLVKYFCNIVKRAKKLTDRYDSGVRNIDHALNEV